ncbi:auxin efflux carrier [Auricularia subglabra TFB-10046 SS5]|nr:auxin efflux carrier [Auricularia subglabra TFB-10046 SS5]
MPSAGALVWMSCRPLIKMTLSTACGFILTRMGVFGPMHARGCGQVVIKVFYPALVFAKLVTGISTQNVSAIGPLFVVCGIYLVLGAFMSLFVTQFFWVPHRFRYGIHASGIFGNFGDIPTAVIMSMTAIPPFRGQQDSDTAVAYISIFTLMFFLVLFPFGGHVLISGDFAGPDRDIEDVRKTVRQQLRLSARRWERGLVTLGNFVRRRKTVEEPEMADDDADGGRPDVQTSKDAKGDVEKGEPDSPGEAEVQNDSEEDATTSNDPPISRTTSPAGEQKAAAKDAAFRLHVARVTAVVQGLITPITIAMLIGLIVAVVRPLKSLFVVVPSSPTPNAPDGQPALAFIMDTATFLGGGAVPLGLTCLGSALAGLKVPRSEWHTLPFGAITSLAVGKLLVMPVLGILIVNAFVRVGFIDASDKVLQFVCIFMACVPTSTTQVFLTQMYSPDGTADHVSAFLLPQYAIMFASMSAVTAYTLQLLF